MHLLGIERRLLHGRQKTVPLKNPVILQGGYEVNENGEPIFFGAGFTGVTATVELAAPATAIKLNIINLVLENGTALGLPVKIKLSNPSLGSNCYIGSNSNPVQIDFTSGTTSPPPPNKPLAGAAGEIKFNEAGNLITVSGGHVVNNSFAAPGANGRGGLFSFLIDPFVNSIVGLPSPAGTNTAVSGRQNSERRSSSGARERIVRPTCTRGRPPRGRGGRSLPAPPITVPSSLDTHTYRYIRQRVRGTLWD